MNISAQSFCGRTFSFWDGVRTEGHTFYLTTEREEVAAHQQHAGTGQGQ